jgi:hypothetical protein
MGVCVKYAKRLALVCSYTCILMTVELLALKLSSQNLFWGWPNPILNHQNVGKRQQFCEVYQKFKCNVLTYDERPRFCTWHYFLMLASDSSESSFNVLIYYSHSGNYWRSLNVTVPAFSASETASSSEPFLPQLFSTLLRGGKRTRRLRTG